MKRIFKLYHKLKEKNFSTLAGAIAFFFVVNGGSLVFLISLLFKLFDFNISDYVTDGDSLFNKILLYFSNNQQELFTPYYYILVFTSLWSSSTLFYHILKAGELIYGIKRKKYPFFLRLLSIFLVLVFISIILSIIILLVLGNYIFKDGNKFILSFLTNVLLMVILPLAVIFYFMLFVPPIRLKFKQVKKGTIFTIVFWAVISIGFQIYLNIFTNYKAIYGAISFVVIAMIYVYLLCNGLVIGLIINYEEINKIRYDNVDKIINGDLDWKKYLSF